MRNSLLARGTVGLLVLAGHVVGVAIILDSLARVSRELEGKTLARSAAVAMSRLRADPAMHRRRA